jgi:hypothetical protein
VLEIENALSCKVNRFYLIVYFEDFAEVKGTSCADHIVRITAVQAVHSTEWLPLEDILCL